MSEQKFNSSADVIKRKHIEEDVGDLPMSKTGRQQPIILSAVEHQVIGHAQIFNIEFPVSDQNEYDYIGYDKQQCKK